MMSFQCTGWWEQIGYGRQSMSDLRLAFSEGEITGSGVDTIGAFQVKGWLEEHRVFLLKHYVGKHQIEYHGESMGEGVYVGKWSCGDYVGGNWMIGFEKLAEWSRKSVEPKKGSDPNSAKHPLGRSGYWGPTGPTPFSTKFHLRDRHSSLHRVHSKSAIRAWAQCSVLSRGKRTAWSVALNSL